MEMNIYWTLCIFLGGWGVKVTCCLALVGFYENFRCVACSDAAPIPNAHIQTSITIWFSLNQIHHWMNYRRPVKTEEDGVNSINENRTPFGPNKAGPEGIKQIWNAEFQFPKSWGSYSAAVRAGGKPMLSNIAAVIEMISIENASNQNPIRHCCCLWNDIYWKC